MTILYRCNPNPLDGSDDLWLLLSVMMLPIEKQADIVDVESFLVRRNGEKVTFIYLFTCAFSWCSGFWFDDFDFLNKGNPTLQSQLWDKLSALNGKETKEDFLKGEEWENFRKICQHIMILSGMPVQSIEKKLDYNEFVRVMIDDEGFFVGID